MSWTSMPWMPSIRAIGLHVLVSQVPTTGMDVPEDVQEHVTVAAVLLDDLRNGLQTAHVPSLPVPLARYLDPGSYKRRKSWRKKKSTVDASRTVPHHRGLFVVHAYCRSPLSIVKAPPVILRGPPEAAWQLLIYLLHYKIVMLSIAGRSRQCQTMG